MAPIHLPIQLVDSPPLCSVLAWPVGRSALGTRSSLPHGLVPSAMDLRHILHTRVDIQYVQIHMHSVKNMQENTKRLRIWNGMSINYSSHAYI